MPRKKSAPSRAASPRRRKGGAGGAKVGGMSKPRPASRLERDAPIVPDETLIREVTGMAARSPVAKHEWTDRGRAGIGYVKGMACTFAAFYMRLLAGHPEVAEMAKPKGRSAKGDVLVWYDEQFSAAGMDNSAGGPDVLRHLFVFLYGLGMQESSGRYCEGRDQSDETVTAETAEAGLFQASYELRIAHALLPKIIARYSADPRGFLQVFREDVVCKPRDWEDYGSGKAMEFQRLTKACPAFAVEYAAIALRHRRTHWDSVNRCRIELLGNCDRMLREVQRATDDHLASRRNRGR